MKICPYSFVCVASNKVSFDSYLWKSQDKNSSTVITLCLGTVKTKIFCSKIYGRKNIVSESVPKHNDAEKYQILKVSQNCGKQKIINFVKNNGVPILTMS